MAVRSPFTTAQATAAEETRHSLAGNGHIVVQADVADAQAIQAMVESVIAQFGRIDVLVNNAGIFEEHALDHVDYQSWCASWTKIITTNLLGAANTSYCVAQHMVKQGGGKIINISSRTAFRGKPEAPAYVASKAGLNSMSQSLAYALAPYGIHVYAVAPSVVDTDMAANDKNSPEWQSIQRQSPLERVCTPQEVAYTVAFLASALTAYHTGGIIDMFGASYFRT